MHRARTYSLIALSLLAALGASSCAGPSAAPGSSTPPAVQNVANGAPSATQAPSAPVSSAPTPSASTAALAFSGSANVKDKFGYTFEASFDLSFGSPVKDVTNDAPGAASAVFPLDTGTWHVDNTTAGRQAEAKFATVNGFYLVYPASSSPCSLTVAEALTDKYCGINIGTTGSSSGPFPSINPSGNLDFTIAPPKVQGVEPPAGTVRVPGIPEAAWGATVGALQKPAGAIATFGLQAFQDEYPSLCMVQKDERMLIVASSPGLTMCA